MANELKQTKNEFKLMGKLTRLDRQGAFNEEVSAQGKRKGETYRKLRFGVKTSETNEILIEMHDYQPKEVHLWNQKLANEAKVKKVKYKGEMVAYGEWIKNKKKLEADGYEVLQTKIFVSDEETGRIVKEGMPRYTASKYIHDCFKNGDSVLIEGEINYSEYESRNGEKKRSRNFWIKRITKQKEDIEFDSNEFKELSFFEQAMVFIGVELDRDNSKAYVTGRMIDKRTNFADSEFALDFSDGKGGIDETMYRLASNLQKKFHFGDVIKIDGNIVNRVIIQEDFREEEDLLLALGGRAKPNHARSWSSKSYISELQIEGVRAWDKKVYQEEDFVKDVLFGEDKLVEELGGRSSSRSNPFKAKHDLDDELELPF
ncbi:hypothetical protein [Thermoactinomyces sp. DSM 45892]|uniref:hypothetical protein n=1 Tax=Thermoactinomyces sp. DSM 45892 TaxID=1882753 RepID=UPI00089D97AD|nr:hypothetical protein [Thermoactinomyces sp. DSM 45892]SDX94020.1 hypothetical protein SAMN05444416_10160 [Thermoactinomyces sp. DSM 45892]